MRPKFKEGEIVIHTLLPRRPMIVVQNKTKLVITDRNFSSETIFTGKIICSWADENEIKKDEFSQQELTLINPKNMIFDDLETDIVSLIQSKTVIEIKNIKASVQTGKIFITRSDILIESGDLLNRTMSNGGIESYKVLDPGYHEYSHGIPAGYTAQVKKLNILEAKTLTEQITYNINGHNTHINNNSIDNSKNLVRINNNQINDKISELRNEIEKLSLSKIDRDEALELIQALAEQIDSSNPRPSVIKTILAGLPDAANIASIGSFLLEAVKNNS